MFKQGLLPAASKKLIDGILGGNLSLGTLKPWRTKFNSNTFIFDDFVKGKFRESSGFSDKPTNALIVYEAGIKPKPTIL